MAGLAKPEHLPPRLTMAGTMQARRELLLHLNRGCRGIQRFNLFGICSSIAIRDCGDVSRWGRGVNANIPDCVVVL